MNAPENGPLRILILEDSVLDAELMQAELLRAQIPITHRRAGNRSDFERLLGEFEADLIFCDLKVPGFSGGEALSLAMERRPGTPVIIVSGTVGEEAAVELLKAGATDFVLKERLSKLGAAVKRALAEVSERRRRQAAEEALQNLNAELEMRIRSRTQELREKNLMMEEDLQMAHDLQLAFLPDHFPTLPKGAPETESAVRFSRLYRPAGGVGGDYFNVHRISDTAIGVLLCDVMGHGVRAALITAMLRALEEQLGDSAERPGQFLTEMNRSLCRLLAQSGTMLFTTACYLVVDIGTRQVRFANAAHPMPILIRQQSKQVEQLGSANTENTPHCHLKGPALGIFEDAEYATWEQELSEHDMILLFTDGIFEVENQQEEMFTENRLRECIAQRLTQPGRELVAAVFEEVRRFAKDGVFSDDVCLLGIEIAHTQPHAA